MADDKPVTKKDLESVIQKVTIQNRATVSIDNATEISKPLIDESKKNDLKRLESEIEQRSLFESMYTGLKGIGDTISDGFNSLASSLKQKGSDVLKFLGVALGAAVGLILAPVFAAGAFFSQLKVELQFLNKLTKGRLGKIFAPVTRFFRRIKIFFSRKGPFGGVIKQFNNLKKIFKGGGAIGKFFSRLKGISKIFNPLIKGFKTGFGIVTKFAATAGRVLGKVFLPVTILMGVFDFIKGFMAGYSEDGILEGIKQGTIAVVDGLFGSLIRLLTKIPQFLLDLFGMEDTAEKLGETVNNTLQNIYGVFSGLFDTIVGFVKGIFTGDFTQMKEGISEAFNSIKTIVVDLFDMIKTAASELVGKLNPFSWFDGDDSDDKDIAKIKTGRRRKKLDDLSSSKSTSPVVVVQQATQQAAPSQGSVSLNPTTIMVNDTDRSVSARRRARGRG